jgi:hypothetical protein
MRNGFGFFVRVDQASGYEKRETRNQQRRVSEAMEFVGLGSACRESATGVAV